MDDNYSMLALQIMNEGQEYDLHVTMAKNERDITMWENHVRKYIAIYSRTGQRFTFKAMKTAAKELKEYYEEHVKEL